MGRLDLGRSKKRVRCNALDGECFKLLIEQRSRDVIFLRDKISHMISACRIIACFSPLFNSNSFVIPYIATSIYLFGVIVLIVRVLEETGCSFS